MENILNLKTYNKYKSLVDDGLILVPDNKLTDAINDVKRAYRDKPIMNKGETHEVMLKAGKKVRITSRGSLRDVEIDGITYNSIEQAACSIYDPYNEYYDIYDEIRLNPLDFTFIPIIDPSYDEIRYTISKYSKGLRKYFDPHKVVKAVYSIDNILFYVKDNKDILRKYYYRIGSFDLSDCMQSICRSFSNKYGMNSTFYLAFFIHEEDLPFTIGATKQDFYALKDILNKISFKGTTPLKYLTFEKLINTDVKRLYQKEDIAFKHAMGLTDTEMDEICNLLDINEEDYDTLMEKELLQIPNKKGKPVTRQHIAKYLNILDNVLELKYYEASNLMWKVKYDDIPDQI
jgi:hypothetical protein